MPGAGSAAAVVGSSSKKTLALATSGASALATAPHLDYTGHTGPDKVGADGGGVRVSTATSPNMRFDAMELEEIPEEEHTGVAKLVHSKAFANIITLTILIGAVQMGAQADISDPDVQWLWDVFEHIFTAVFGIEMALKVFVLRASYFKEPWNILDFVISWISIVGAWIIPFYIAVSQVDGGSDSSASLGVLRVFRLLRLFRILKIMKAVPELRMVIEGIAASLRAMFWVCILLFIVIYMFSIYCVEILGRAETGFPGYNNTTESIITSKFFANFNSWEYFGNIPRAMLSLFGVTLLAEYDVIRPVWECNRFSVVLFVLLIFLTSFGIVNVIIGVIVERTTSSMAEMERESELKRHEEAQAHICRLAEIVWARTDSDGSGTISREELGECAGSADIVRLFKSLDWPKGWTLGDLHMMLDTDGGGELTQTEFCDGMHRLIFGNDFQKACMNMLTAGQIKQVSNAIKAVTSEELVRLRHAVSDIQKNLAMVLAEVRGLAHPVVAHPAKLAMPRVSVEVQDMTLDIQTEIAQKDMVHVGEHGAVASSPLPTVAVTGALRNAIDTSSRPLPSDFDAGSDEEVTAERWAPCVDNFDGWRRRAQTGKTPMALRSAGTVDARVAGSNMPQDLRTWRCSAEGPLGLCSAEDRINVRRDPLA